MRRPLPAIRPTHRRQGWDCPRSQRKRFLGRPGRRRCQAFIPATRRRFPAATKDRIPEMRLTRPFSARGSVSSGQSRTWPWAAGSIAAVVLVLGSALIGHTIAAHRHATPLIVAAPWVPPLAVVAATPAGISTQLVALDSGAGHLVALTTSGQPTCPPVAACPPAPPLQRFMVFDGQTGAVLATSPLTGDATQSALLLVDPSRHLAYAISPAASDVYSTVTGQRIDGYLLPTLGWSRVSGGVLNAADGELILAGNSSVAALDAATGQSRAVWQAPPGTSRIAGPVLDTERGLVYELAQPTAGQPTLVALNAATLAVVGQAPFPAGSRLGPFDAATQTLYVFGKSGTPCQYTVNTTTGLAFAPAASAGMSCVATNVGWNPALGHLYAAGPSGVSIHTSGASQPIAALPLRVAWPASSPLLIDAPRDLLYLPDEHGTILIARDSATPAASLPVGSAVLLARAALGHFLPDTNQDPPFIAPERFPAAAGTTSLSYWQHYADIGWQGPYAGTIATAVTAVPGKPGSYLVTFTMSWYQLLQRQHTWVCRVAPDGSVLLQADSGDPVP